MIVATPKQKVAHTKCLGFELHSPQALAFTLIELLVVMAIIGLLASMILAFITIGQRGSDENSTKALMNTIATAINEFAGETGAVPLPRGSSVDAESGSWYPTENNGPWDKQQLWWRLNHEMTVAERATLYDKGLAADIAADPYQDSGYMRRTHGGTRDTEYNTKVMPFVNSKYGLTDNYFAANYRRNLGDTSWLSGGSGYGTSDSPSKLGFYKKSYLAIKGAIAKDLAERTYLTHPCLDLGEILGEEFLKDQTIVDAWGNPLIYVAHSIASIPSVQPGYEWPFIDAPAHGRNSLSDRNLDGTIDFADWMVVPPEIGEAYDHNGDGLINAADKVFKFDRNEDGTIDEKDWRSILWNSLPGRENSFFLASAGVDGEFNVLMGSPENSDNVNLMKEFDE